MIAAAIAAVFVVAYFFENRNFFGEAVNEPTPQTDASAATSSESQNNIGTTEGDGESAPLAEIEIGGGRFVDAGGDKAKIENAVLPNAGGDSQTAEVCLKNTCYRVELAFTAQQRAQGLMFRKNLEQYQGMLFVFENAGIHGFWMKNTLIPLDIVWIGENKKIIYISQNTPPCAADSCPNYGPREPAKYVLELNAGQIKKIGAAIGDEIAINH